MRFKHFIKLRRKNIYQFLILYCCILFYIVFLTPNRYKSAIRKINFTPFFKTAKRFNERGNEHFWAFYIDYWGNIFGNLVLFIPFGFLLGWLYPNQSYRHIGLYAFLASLFIEFSQLVLQIGVCDIDDIILNVGGALIGIWMSKKFKNKQA